jgi:hypothetical protein
MKKLYIIVSLLQKYNKIQIDFSKTVVLIVEKSFL